MNTAVARDLDVRRFAVNLFSGFGLVAVVLAAVGLYGLMAYAAGQRVREVGIRMALGSTGPAVARRFMAEGLLVGGAGIVLGLIGAMAATRLLTALLFGVTPLDTATFAAAGMLLMAIAALATTIPAVRASRIDPVHVLRTE